MENQEREVVITRVEKENEHMTSSIAGQSGDTNQDISRYLEHQGEYPLYQNNIGGSLLYFNDLASKMFGATLKETIRREEKMATCCVEVNPDVGLAFFDAALGGRRLFSKKIGRFSIARVLVCNAKYSFALIEIDEQAIVLKESEIKPNAVHDAFVRAGFIFNPSITRTKAGTALCDFLHRKLGEKNQWIELSGDAGWEDGVFQSAADFWYLRDYRFEIKIPVFEKRFDKEAKNIARIADYCEAMKRIRNPRYRLIMALMPFAGILYTPFLLRNRMLPFAVNIVIMTDTCNLADLMWYLQVFNRDNPMRPYDAGMSGKQVKQIIASSKDEVIVFAGFEETFGTYYSNKKNLKMLNLLAQKALGRLGGEYGEKGFQSALVLISNQQILQPGVKHIYVDDDFLVNHESENHLDSIQAVLALFVDYAESFRDDLDTILDGDKRGKSRAEIFWMSLIDVVDDFWRALNSSLKAVLGLSEDFDFSFLWKENESSLEHCSGIVKKVIRKEMQSITVVKKEESSSQDSFVYDDEFVWIAPDLLYRILDNEGLGTLKNQVLLGCRNEGFLITNPSERGFTTRLQTNGNRREFYKFDRQRLTDLGEVEILDLAGGNEHC